MTLGPIDWPASDLAIPITSPTAVDLPAYPSWLDLAQTNRATLDASPVEIAGVRLSELRRRARNETLSLGFAYTRDLGIDVPGGGDAIVLCTSHQPILFHPGIWIKYLAMARAVPHGSIGVNLIIDSDVVRDVAADVPRADGRLGCARVSLAVAGPAMPLEALPTPSDAEWHAFANAVDGHLVTLRSSDVAAGWMRARRRRPLSAQHGLAGAVTATRRGLEGPRRYIDVPVSFLFRTAAFRRFALAFLSDAARFAEMHNACLASYRRHYRIRPGPQPFRDLDQDSTRVEAPFWVVEHGRRFPLFVDVRTRCLVVNGRPVADVPDDPDDPAFASIAIRPRALTLTAFARLVLADLFIHGVGGLRYDRATDVIVEAFLGIRPPAHATVTATLHLPLPMEGLDEQRRRLQRTLRDLRHKPDRFLAAEGPHRPLVEEKWTLIRRLDSLSRPARHQARQRLRDLNVSLQPMVADRVAEILDSLQRLGPRSEEARVATYRGYPFLLFPIEAVDALVERLADRHSF